ncbi:MAG: glycosyltransferase family 2 protein [Anaerolineae bacterium]
MIRPSVSVIIPTFNRPEQLACCLEALARSDYPRDRLEVVVVDDGGQRSPEAEVAAAGSRLDIVLLRQRNAGPAAARNTGAARATGELLAFTDDDCLPDRGWVAALAARYLAQPDHLLGGRTLNALPENPCSAASQHLIDYLYAYGEKGGATRFYASNNLAVAAESFRALNGFDSTYTRAASEDRDLCHRWLCRGRPLAYVPEALVYHAKALTLRGFLRQHRLYGCGARQFREARAQRGAAHLRFEPPAFYLNLVGQAFRLGEGRRAPLLAGLLLLSQVAHAVGYGEECLRRTARRGS